MPADLEHEEIYSLTEAPVKMDGEIVIGSRVTTITQTKGEEGFFVMVKTGKSVLDRAHTDIVKITPPMLAAMR